MKHTPNGPSSLSKRALCPASLSQEIHLVRDRFDEYADSGSRCHEAMENTLKGLPVPNLTDEEFAKVKFAVDALNHLLSGDMVIAGTGTTKSGGIVLVELTMENLPYSLPGSPECGTLDLAIVYPDHILLPDWKFGGSFVDHPKWNKQIKALCLGLWEMYPGREIHAAIVQPRAGADHRIEPWVFFPDEREEITKGLQQILIDCQTHQDVFCVGRACQFCEAAKQNTCIGRRQALGVFAERDDLNPSEMDSETRARFLMAARAAKASAEQFIKDCKTQVQQTGEIPDGWRAAPTSTGGVRIDPNPGAPSWPQDHAPRRTLKDIEF